MKEYPQLFDEKSITSRLHHSAQTVDSKEDYHGEMKGISIKENVMQREKTLFQPFTQIVLLLYIIKIIGGQINGMH